MQTFNDISAKNRFFAACKSARAFTPGGGIGTLSEKQLHSAVKFFIEPNMKNHEIPVGRNVADVRNEHGIFEVQTASFGSVKNKLSAFLEKDIVTIVHPIPAKKRIFRLDEHTGALSAPRVSPKRGNEFDAFRELYRLEDLAAHPNFRLLLLFIDIDEYRLEGNRRVGGRLSRKGYTRFERMPVALDHAVYFASPMDYASILPPELPQHGFTSSDLADAARIRLSAAQTTLTVLARIGAVCCTGKTGRYKKYIIPQPAAPQ